MVEMANEILHKGTNSFLSGFLCYLEICSDPPKFCPKEIDKRKSNDPAIPLSIHTKSLKTVKTQNTCTAMFMLQHCNVQKVETI